jgi:hypothetical protein
MVATAGPGNSHTEKFPRNLRGSDEDSQASASNRGLRDRLTNFRASDTILYFIIDARHLQHLRDSYQSHL